MKWSRRTFPLRCLALLAAIGASARAAGPPVRVGLTPVFLDDQAAFLQRWRDYLATRLGREVQFIQRGSYREVVEMVRSGRLDFAWLCGYPYVRIRGEARLLAVPLYRGKPVYQSYLIVSAADTDTRSLLDLRGKVFAYSDPDSNSGFLYTQHALSRIRERGDAFFRRSFFTWAHRKVVEAVAVGLAQAGAVDGYVWDTLARTHPEITARTRVVEVSPDFGFPPFVARAGVDGEVFEAMQDALLGMPQDETGRALLARLNLDGFVSGEERLFDGIETMARAYQGR